MSEPQRSRYIGWDPGKQPVKSNERRQRDLYNGSVSHVEHQSQTISAQRPAFVAAAARMAAANAKKPGSGATQGPPASPSKPTAAQERSKAAKSNHARFNSISATAAAALSVRAANSSSQKSLAKTGAATAVTKRSAAEESKANGDWTPERADNRPDAGDRSGLAKNAASTALTETPTRGMRNRDGSVSSLSSVSLLFGSTAIPTVALSPAEAATSAAAATAIMRSRQPSVLSDLDYESIFTDRERDEASHAAQLAAPSSLGIFSEIEVGVPTTDLSPPQSARSLELKDKQHAAQPKKVLTAQASAAARASTLRPIQVAPREPLSSKFVSSLSASLKSQNETKNKENEAMRAESQRQRNLAIEQTAARLSATRELEMHDAASASSAGTDGPSQSARSALAAAVRATPLAETEVIRIQQVVAARSRRKKRFKPSGQWSGGGITQPQRTNPANDRPQLLSRWSQSTAPRNEASPSETTLSSYTSDGPPSPTKKNGFFSRMFRKSANTPETSLMTLEATPSPVLTPPVPKKHLKQTMRDGHVSKKKIFNEEKPWKHHLEAHVISEKERKRYEKVWAANKGGHVPLLASIVEATSERNGLLPPGLGELEGYRSSQSLLSTASGNTQATSQTGIQGGTQAGTGTQAAPHLGSQPIPTPAVPPAHAAANLATNNVSMALSPVASSLGVMNRQSFDGRSIQSVDTLEQYERQQLEDIHGYVVAQLWRRSHLSDDVLCQVWDLVDNNQDGTLDRSSFVVGMWLVDQCLYGRKLPTKVDDAIWKSVGHLQVKIRVKNPRKKLLRVKYLRHRKRASAATAIDPYLSLPYSTEPTRNLPSEA